MPLILAIEPDRRQASQLTAIVRGRLHAELVLAESAERALAALGDRVPDLILTSALLSPKDEAALGERLRAFDGAAAYVQTLTIPVLAPPGKPRSASSGRRMLSALRRDRAKPSAPAGCDPGVFADQCRDYLERAEAERMVYLANQPAGAQIEPVPIEPPPPAIEASRPIERAIAIDAPQPTEKTPAQPVADERPAFVELSLLEAAPASLIAAVAALEAFESATATAEPFAVEAAPSVEEAPSEEEPLALEELLDEEEPLWAEEQPSAPIATPVAESLVTDDAGRGEIGDTGGLELDLTSLFDDAAEGPGSSPSVAAQQDDEPIVYEIDEATLVAAPAAPEMTPRVAVSSQHQGATLDTELHVPLPMAARWPPLGSYVAELKVSTVASHGGGTEPEEPGDWLDIIEALRRDAQQVKFARSGPGQVETREKKRRRQMGSPVQDEWGFFDPDKCGFAALLEKLEEITDQEDGPAPRGA